jgi:hypothetical protein
MKKTKNNKLLINLVILLLSSTIAFSQEAYIPPVVGSSGYNYISASSTMLPDLGYNFVPKNIDDNSLYTWWSPLREDNSTCWIKINFDKERLINKIQIHGGAHYPNYKLGNLYFLNLRIKSATLTYSDGSSKVINLEDIDKIQTINLPSKYTSYVILRPSSYYPSYRWKDPCISYIKFGN